MAAQPSVAELMEEVELIESAESAIKRTDEPDFGSAGGLIPRGEGGVVDISDPTRLITIYESKTGEPRPVPAWTLTGKNSILRRKHEDGTRVFSDKQSGDWAPGEVPCMLHAQHPRRDEFRKMGLINNCKSGNLASVYDQQQHMKLRHRREWATIEAAETRNREDEEREFRRLQAQVATATLAASNSKKAS
jgi:hypothetical protein